MLDVFSRYVVGWMVAHRESATLAERFIRETCARQGIHPATRKAAIHWTRLSCQRFRANEVRLLLGVIAYNLGNLLRRLVLPIAIQSW
jgi:transposase InsO family protein